MLGGGSGHISQMNKTAEENRNALNSHEKKRRGRFFKSKKKFNLTPKRRTSPLLISISVLSITVFLIFLSYSAIQNYLAYERTPPVVQETSEFSQFLSHVESGRINLEDQNYEDAVHDFEAALAICPDNSEAQNGLKEAEKRWESQQ